MRDSFANSKSRQCIVGYPRKTCINSRWWLYCENGLGVKFASVNNKRTALAYLFHISALLLKFTVNTGGVSLISRHATVQNILSIFAHHILQSFNVEGSKGHIICGCAQDYGCLCNCFSLILCLFETCSKEKPSALSCIRPNATLFWECVFSDKNSSWAIVMMMFAVWAC